jgi:hypothetical protein
MKEPFLKGPTRLFQRPDIGNVLWWIAKRHMSSRRLSHNREFIQTRIAKIEKKTSLRTFTATLGFSLLFGTIAWGTSWQITQLLPTNHPLKSEPAVVSTSPSLQKLRQIKLFAAPPVLEPSDQRQVKPAFLNRKKLPNNPVRPLQTTRKPAHPQLGSPDTQKTAYPLSKLLKRFRKAKQAHEAGHLDQATQQFLKIAREQSHPSLGPESYLRAIAIIRAQGYHQRALDLLNEAKEHWPDLKESTKSGLR